MPRVRILKLNDQTAHAERWEASVRAFTPARTLKRESHSAVFAGDLRGRRAVVKLADLVGPLDRLAMTLGVTRLQRQWVGHERLAAMGVGTARPVCLARIDEPEPTSKPRLLLALEYVEGLTLIDHLSRRDLPAKTEARVCEALGRQIATIALAGRRNRDHKLSNVVLVDASQSVVPDPEEQVVLAVIDAAGLRRSLVRGPAEAAARMLFSAVVEPTGLRLTIPRTMRVRVARACARVLLGEAPDGRGTPVSRALTLWLMRRAEQTLRAHGDPTPRTDPRTGVSAAHG